MRGSLRSWPRAASRRPPQRFHMLTGRYARVRLDVCGMRDLPYGSASSAAASGKQQTALSGAVCFFLLAADR